MIEGKLAWSPDLAGLGSGFDASYFAPLALVETDSFWFVSRNALLIWVLQTYFPGFRSLLEIGCGTGFVLEGFSRAFPSATFTGSEIFSAGLQIAAKRVPQASLMQMDARALPYDGEFEVVGAFDVLEHIKEDTIALRGMFDAVKPGGGVAITVPQHPWLWSQADEYAQHQRRYTRHEMRHKVEETGFEIIRDTSFVTLPLPAMVMSRFKTRSGTYDPLAEMKIQPMANKVLLAMMTAERHLIRAGIDLPIGGSRLIVARRPK